MNGIFKDFFNFCIAIILVRLRFYIAIPVSRLPVVELQYINFVKSSHKGDDDYEDGMILPSY